MPLRKPTDTEDDALDAIQQALSGDVPKSAFHYEAELNVETVKRIQQKADETLKREEWIVIDGVDKQ